MVTATIAMTIHTPMGTSTATVILIPTTIPMITVIITITDTRMGMGMDTVTPTGIRMSTATPTRTGKPGKSSWNRTFWHTTTRSPNATAGILRQKTLRP